MCACSFLALPLKFRLYFQSTEKKKKQPTVHKHIGEGSRWTLARQAGNREALVASDEGQETWASVTRDV